MTPREIEVYNLVKKGLRNKQIAEKLGISIHTVKVHMTAILAHHGAKDRLDLLFKKKY